MDSTERYSATPLPSVGPATRRTIGRVDYADDARHFDSTARAERHVIA